MSLFPTPGLGESIVQELRNGPLETKDLVTNVRRHHGDATVQGIYKALRALRAQEIVFLQRKEASLNLRWLQRVESFASLAENAYKDPTASSGHFLQMRDGDRIVYALKNAIQVDAFWNHVLYVLLQTIPDIDRWYAYASHCWFLLGRRKEEIALRDFMTGRGVRYLFTVGHRMPLDRALARDFDGTMAQYHMLGQPLFPHRPNHLGIVLNVIGDYVIEAHYDKHTTDRIEQIYASHAKINAQTIADLEAVLAHPAKIKLVIMKNQTKARKIAKMFQKYFYFGKK